MTLLCLNEKVVIPGSQLLFTGHAVPWHSVSLWAGYEKSPLGFPVTCFTHSGILLVVALRCGKAQASGIGTQVCPPAG